MATMAVTLAATLAAIAAVVANLKSLFDAGVKLLDGCPESVACPLIVTYLSEILSLPETAEPLNHVGRKTLFEKMGGLTILGHHHPESVWSQPHDHGRTWAIYGVVSGYTAMYTYDILRPAEGKKKGKVKLANRYWIMPGQAFWYPTGLVHSHKTYEDSRLIRIEGFNLWRRELKPGGHRYTLCAEK